MNSHENAMKPLLGENKQHVSQKGSMAIGFYNSEIPFVSNSNYVAH